MDLQSLRAKMSLLGTAAPTRYGSTGLVEVGSTASLELSAANLDLAHLGGLRVRRLSGTATRFLNINLRTGALVYSDSELESANLAEISVSTTYDWEGITPTTANTDLLLALMFEIKLGPSVVVELLAATTSGGSIAIVQETADAAGGKHATFFGADRFKPELQVGPFAGTFEMEIFSLWRSAS